ncbi:immunoglobulin kappa light chain-like [Salvelinus fontinalis]|uniref:immunoglobulin kappa light chain-like n=1 Tax=Salvelinus fontinalis TaxID=8038 RepID=UPI002484F5FA|nr:immunoglobulin kappa light chain-like [Salvelinus fontinalis]
MPGPLLLLLCWSYVLKATHTSVITQTPGVVMVNAGDTVTLKCHLSEIITYCFYVSWMKVDPRTGTHSMSTDLKVDNISKDQEQDNLCSVTFTNAKVSDSGMYYCSAVHSKMVYSGNGSKVIVLTERERVGNSTKAPTLQIVSSPEGDSSFIPLLCLVLEVVPSQVRVFWLIDGREESGLTDSTWTDNSESATEFTRNQILVQAEEWNRRTEFTCVVEFEGKNLTKTLLQHNDSNAMCTMLMYGASAAALLAIIVAVTTAVCLHRGHPVVIDADTRQRGTDTENRQDQSGRRGEARRAVRSSFSEVQYATLDHINFGRRTNTVLQSDFDKEIA